MFEVKIKQVLNESTGEVGDIFLKEDQVSDYLSAIESDLSNVVIVSKENMTPADRIEQKVLMDEIALAKKLFEDEKNVSEVYSLDNVDDFWNGFKDRLKNRREQLGK